MKHRRIFISADMEGVVGVVSKAQYAPGERDYERARKWMTSEVVAACDAALAAGVEEIVVADAHFHADNILLEELREPVQLVRSWPRELMMSQGVELGSYDGALLLGYHVGSRGTHGVLAHTFSADVIEMTLNGQVMSETTINAAIAGHFGVPVIMVSGDDAYTEHATQVLGPVETATVKWAYGTFSERTKSLPASCKLIAASVTRALDRLGDFKPYRLEGPLDLQIENSSRFKAEVLEFIPGVERLSSHRIGIQVSDIIAVSRFLNLYLRISAVH
jgi:D-amino peptidase